MADGTSPVIEKPKHAGGRPPLYRVEFCERIIELGKLGYSQARMAADLDVAKATINLWANEHQEFLNALTRARTYSQAYWEERGHNGLENRNFNTPLYLGSMKSMFRDDYMDRSVSEIVGKDGEAIEIKDSGADARRVAFMLGRAIGRAESKKSTENEQKVKSDS